ncbi:NYN domain-containing protein [Irpex lacteus]|nr:NYN domain-containing protein [Irpex lacteus]
MNRQRQPVAIFWDFENCALHNKAGGWEVDNIRRIALKYGPIKIFKAYLEISARASPESLALRSELQSCGVSLTDCPHNGRKDVADKMLLVDMMAFALDTEAPATIVLLSGDRDFVYALSVLGNRGYHTVVIAPQHSHPKFSHRASEILDWDALVVRKQDAPHGRRRASDITGLRPNIDTSQRSSNCAPSPSGSSLLSPFLNTGRRLSFKEDGNAAPPRPSHGRADSEQLPRVPWLSANLKQSSPTKASRLILDLAASESALDDTEDLLFSPDAGAPPAENGSIESSFADIATNLNTNELCSDSTAPQGAPRTPSTKHADIDSTLSNVNQPNTIGEPSIPSPQPTVAVQAESAQPAVSQPIPPPTQVITPYLPPSGWPTTLSTLSNTPAAANEPAQSQSTSLPVQQPVPHSISATVLGSPQPALSEPAALLDSQSTFVNANMGVETVSASEIQGAGPFLLMIHALDECRRAGSPKVLRTALAPRLVQHNPNIYKQAGSPKFKSYITLAEKIGIVDVGGTGPDAWVSLRPKWYGQGRAP